METAREIFNHPFTKGARREARRKRDVRRDKAALDRAKALPHVTPEQVSEIPMSVWTGVDPPDLAQLGINLMTSQEAEEVRQDMAAQGTLRVGPGAPIPGEVLNTVQRQRKREGFHADGVSTNGAPNTGAAGTGANYQDRLYDAIGTLTSAITTLGGAGGGPPPGTTDIGGGLSADFASDQVRTTGDVEGGEGLIEEERTKLRNFGANRFVGDTALQAAANANAEGKFRGHKGLKDEAQWVVGAKFAQANGFDGAIARGSAAGLGGACPPGHICWTAPSKTIGKFQTYSLALYDLVDSQGRCTMPGEEGCASSGTSAARAAERRAGALIGDFLTPEDLASIGIHGGTSDPGVMSAEEAAYYIGGRVGGVGASDQFAGLGWDRNYRGTDLGTWRGVLQGHLASRARATKIDNHDGTFTYNVPTMSLLQFQDLAVIDAERRARRPLSESEIAAAKTKASEEYSGYRQWWARNGAYQSGSEETRTTEDDYVPGGIQEGRFAGVWVRTPDGTYSYAPILPPNRDSVAAGHATDPGVAEGFGDSRGANWRAPHWMRGDPDPNFQTNAIYDRYGRCLAHCPTVHVFGTVENTPGMWQAGYGGAEWNQEEGEGAYSGAYQTHAGGGDWTAAGDPQPDWIGNPLLGYGQHHEMTGCRNPPCITQVAPLGEAFW